MSPAAAGEPPAPSLHVAPDPGPTPRDVSSIEAANNTHETGDTPNSPTETHAPQPTFIETERDKPEASIVDAAVSEADQPASDPLRNHSPDMERPVETLGMQPLLSPETPSNSPSPVLNPRSNTPAYRTGSRFRVTSVSGNHHDPEDPATPDWSTYHHHDVKKVDRNLFKRNMTIAKGFFDISLLSANSNQLRNLVHFGDRTQKSFYVILALLIVSLVMQVCLKYIYLRTFFGTIWLEVI